MTTLGIVLGVAVLLTIALFLSKEPMLGFACVIFWIIAGAQAYTMRLSTWDVPYAIFFGSFGMVLLCGIGSFQYYKGSKKGRRNEDTDFIDEEDRSQYIGENKNEADRAERTANSDAMSESDMPSDRDIDRPSRPSVRTQDLRDRARKRKTGLFRKKTNWGEWK